MHILTANISKDYIIQKLTFTAPDSSSQYNVEPVFEPFEGKLAVKALKYHDLSGAVSINVNLSNDKIGGIYLPVVAAIKFRMMGMEMNNIVHFKNFKIDLQSKEEFRKEAGRKVREVKKSKRKRH